MIPVIEVRPCNDVVLYDEEGDVSGRWTFEEAVEILDTLREHEGRLREHIAQERARRRMSAAGEAIARTGPTRNVSYTVDDDGALTVEVSAGYLRQVADRHGLRVEDDPHPTLAGYGWRRRSVAVSDGVTFAYDHKPESAEVVS